MTKNVLILGASGTVGSAVFRQLSRCDGFHVFGTCYSRDYPAMIRFSLDSDVLSLLEQVQPDIVVSALRGDFEKQLSAHSIAADYLAAHGGKMIFLSTANVFDGSLEKPHFEADERISVSDYGQFKIQCEDVLQKRLGRQAVIVRLPFVWGRNSPRMQAVKAGCRAGQLDVYGLRSNHVLDLQIAELIEWIICEDKSGIFHAGTSDVTDYQDFIERLIAAMGAEKPRLICGEASGVMAVLNSRTDIPQELMDWDSGKLIRCLCTL